MIRTLTRMLTASVRDAAPTCCSTSDDWQSHGEAEQGRAAPGKLVRDIPRDYLHYIDYTSKSTTSSSTSYFLPSVVFIDNCSILLL